MSIADYIPQTIKRAYYSLKGWIYGAEKQEAIVISTRELDITTFDFE